MVRDFQVAIDCAGPRALGAFWAEALGYVEDPPPPGYSSWEEVVAELGLADDEAYALVDPDGKRPRVFFHKVPEGKTVKNRVHLDVRVSGMAGGNRDGKDSVLTAEAERLERLGAKVLRTVDEGFDYFIVLQDPEGNEFCLT